MDFPSWVPLFFGALIPFLIVITPLVFIHEYGHYIVARWCGVGVKTFSVGFGPALFSWKDRAGTTWKIASIPFGGYVAFKGDSNPASLPSGEQQDVKDGDEIYAKGPAKRALIATAGPVANLLGGFLIYMGLFMTYGHIVVPPVVGEVIPDTVAQEAGFRAGDLIRKINGEEIDSFVDIPPALLLGVGAPVSFEIERNGRLFQIIATPRMQPVEGRASGGAPIPFLGIRAPVGEAEHKSYSVWESFVGAGERTVFFIKTTGVVLWKMITGGASDLLQSLAGPLGIAQISGEVASGGLAPFLEFTAILSISLFLFNILPLPVLDGGHVFLCALEGARGRPLGEKAQKAINAIGLGLILSLFLLVTANDILRMLQS